MANWIQGAIKRPGSLHRALNVPQGKNIPASKLRQGARGGTDVKRKVALANTLKKLH